MNIDPRADFQTKHKQDWQDLSDSAMFREAVKTALLIVARYQPAPPDMGNAAANAFRLQGAMQMADTLASLADDRTPSPQRVTDHLNPTK